MSIQEYLWATKSCTVKNVYPQRVYRGDDCVDADVELVARHQQRVCHEFLRERTKKMLLLHLACTAAYLDEDPLGRGEVLL